MFSLVAKEWMQFGGLGLLGGLLGAAVWCDLREYRIPNRIVLSGTTIALLLHAFVPQGVNFMGALSEIGLLQALGGLAIGLGSLLPLYLIRATGAGDAKLMAMVGAFLGPKDALGAVIFSFSCGAFIALACAIKAGVVRQTAYNVRLIVYSVFARLAAANGPSFDSSTETAAKIPYTLAIAAGTAAWVGLRHFVALGR